MPEFGKHGKGVFHPWVLNQDKVWINNDGDEYTIDEMDIVYIENVMNFLTRRVRARKRVGKKMYNTAAAAEKKLKATRLYKRLDEEYTLRMINTQTYEID